MPRAPRQSDDEVDTAQVRSLALEARRLNLENARLMTRLSGTYGSLLDYIMFVVMIFYALTIIGLFVLRKKRPEMERPYKAFGYPVLPAIYILLALWVVGVMFLHKMDFCLYGLVIVLIGVPVYFIFKRNRKDTGDHIGGISQ